MAYERADFIRWVLERVLELPDVAEGVTFARRWRVSIGELTPTSHQHVQAGLSTRKGGLGLASPLVQVNRGSEECVKSCHNNFAIFWGHRKTLYSLKCSTSLVNKPVESIRALATVGSRKNSGRRLNVVLHHCPP